MSLKTGSSVSNPAWRCTCRGWCSAAAVSADIAGGESIGYFKMTLFCAHVKCEALFSRGATQMCSGETPEAGGCVGGWDVWPLPWSLRGAVAGRKMERAWRGRNEASNKAANCQ
ncbi:hypothetical protein E2C01_067105 [Portunus trituberculatus]|uniref:Uncharacterized protein n=1 Tax=Portunus trituberculatus TaxID=210409 RepID=A0A5B7HN93_PORTR|nr:hypothetical protein [Portunus trituberculatus]